MGEMSRALGAGSVYTFKDKQYRFGGWTLGVQSEYELYLENVVLTKARLLRKLTPPEELAQCDPYLITVRDVNSGAYSFGGLLCQESLRNEKNLQKAVHIMLGETEGNGPVSLALVQEMFKEDAAGVMEALMQADRDPNAVAPAAA